MYYYFLGPIFNLIFLMFSWKWKITYMFHYLGLVGYNKNVVTNWVIWLVGVICMLRFFKQIAFPSIIVFQTTILIFIRCFIIASTYQFNDLQTSYLQDDFGRRGYVARNPALARKMILQQFTYGVSHEYKRSQKTSYK